MQSGAKRKGTAGEIRGAKSTLGGASERGAAAEGRLVQPRSPRWQRPCQQQWPRPSTLLASFPQAQVAKPAVKRRRGEQGTVTKGGSPGPARYPPFAVVTGGYTCPLGVLCPSERGEV